MEIQGRVVVVTGGANGIGRAMCHKFAQEGARGVVVADLDKEGAQRVAKEINGFPITTNAAKEADVKLLVEATTNQFGHIDVLCSNAGIGVAGGPEAPDKDWQRSWEVNVMAHVYAARAVLPQMLERKEGYLVQTVSAAGLLMQIGSAPYSVTKHAALSFAEYLAVTYGDQGIRVSALCPMGVKTDMLRRADFAGGAFLLEGALEPEQVAQAVVEGMKQEKFLILPHPEVEKFFQNKAGDYDRWLRGMRKLQSKTEILKAQV